MSRAPARLQRPLSLLLEAAGEDQVFSTGQARAQGITAADLRRLESARVAVRLGRGWYGVHDPTLDGKQRHVRRTHALLRAHKGSAVASHHSALLLAGIPAFAADVDTVHLTYREGGANRARPGFVAHVADRSTCNLPSDDLAVPVAHSIVQAGMLAGPLATLVAGDHALRFGLTTSGELESAAAAHRGCRGIAPVVEVLPRLDARAESPPESLVRYMLEELGYTVEPQIAVRVEGRDYRGDLGIPELMLIVEVDGRVKYEGLDAAAVAMAEKTREAALRRAGWMIVRLTWSEIVTPSGVLRPENVRAFI